MALTGKGHTMAWLNSRGLFPSEAFVKVDPDALRELLPETKEYIKRNPATAGYLTQKEVGYIAEVSIPGSQCISMRETHCILKGNGY
jgi:hypothetical protein